MPLGVQYSGMWTLAQQFQAVGAGTWKNINQDYLWTWGINNNGQLGTNSLIYRSSPVQIGTQTNWSSISGGQYHVMALQPDGTMWSWGINTSGQLGDGTLIKRSSPVQIGSLTTWSKIAAATNHALAIKTDGTLWAWGLNNDGRLGDNSVILRSSPIQVGTAVYGWSEVTTGQYNTFAIDLGGELWSWGNNGSGQIGDNTVIHRSSPVQVGTDTTWSKVSNFSSFTLATKTDSSLWTFGYNNAGQLGQNDVIARSSPVQVGALATWSKISAGSSFSAAIKTDGTMWAWGLGTSGQIGDNTVISRSSPIQVGSLSTWSKISGSGELQVAAIKTDGTLWTWGSNNFGSIGDSTVIARSSPVQLGADTNWSQVALGDKHTVAVKTNGTLWTWGYNVNGELGDNTVLSRSSPVQVGAGVTWLLVSTASQYHTIATKTDGTLWAWGAGTRGQLGNSGSTITNKISSPIQIGALTTWSKISAGREFSAAIKTDTTLWIWGSNSNAQLGQNDMVYRSSPTLVGASTFTAETTTWSLAAGGGYHSMAIKTDGTMWTWGRNINGNLGSNTTVYRSSPVQVGALTTWSKISPGFKQSVAIKTDGTMWSWGANNNGQLGSNTITYRSSPVQIGALTTWSKIATGTAGNFTTVIKTDGTMWSWGQAINGSLGLNDVIYRSSPVQIGALTTWSLIAGGKYHAVALKTDGTLWTWGRNIEGSVGDETILNRSSPVQIGVDTTWSVIAAARETSMAIYHEVT